jgi:hypothetical protein
VIYVVDPAQAAAEADATQDVDPTFECATQDETIAI